MITIEINKIRPRYGKKTQEQYKEEVKNKNKDIEIIGKYINAKTKILHKCLICGNEWESAPTNILSGCGCPKCKSKRKTNDQFLIELNNITSTILPLEEYKISNKKILVKCLLCSHEWATTPDSLLRGHGCPECEKRKKFISYEEFNERIKDKNITIIGDYINASTKIKVKCNLCNFIWETKPDNLFKSKSCPNCNKIKQTKTHENYLKELKCKNINIVPLEKYKQALTPILHECGVCHYKWKVSPDNVLHNYKCPECAKINVGLRHRLTNEEFLERLYEKHGNTIVPLQEYVLINEPIKFHCNCCGYEWDTAPQNIICKGHGCPLCTTSRGEKEVLKYLKEHNIRFVQQKTFKYLKGVGNKSIKFDFYIEDFNLLIEYNGIQHYEPVEYFGGIEKFKIQQEHDRRKREYAKNNNMQLLEIKYNENVFEKLNTYFNYKE